MVTGLAIRDAVVRYTTSAGDTRLPPNKRRVITWVPPKLPTRGDERTITAVDHVSLDVAPGEVLALLGPSGSGKSSLLRAIAGLEPLASGTMTWDGKNLAGVPTHKRGFGMMFQEAALFPSLDVGRNVAYGLHKVPRSERPRRVVEALEAVGLPGFERRKVTELSGGQAQRVALARSLAPGPRMLLLDEPLSALDRGLRERMVEVIAQILRDVGITAVHVTHDQDEAFTLADRVAVLADGRLLQTGTPSELWRRPVSLQVAEFLGYGTFLTAEDAAAFGITALAERGVVGLGPQSLVRDPNGVSLEVRSEHARRGYTSTRVVLPSGRLAELRLPEPVRSGRVGVRVDEEGVALVLGG